MSGVNFKEFKREWLNHMVHRYSEEDLEENLHNEYINYKEESEFESGGCRIIKDSFASRMTVKEFCHFFYVDSHIDSHYYMLKVEYEKNKL